VNLDLIAFLLLFRVFFLVLRVVFACILFIILLFLLGDVDFLLGLSLLALVATSRNLLLLTMMELVADS